MKEIPGFKEKIFQIYEFQDFESVSLNVFRFQAARNPVYRKVSEAFSVNPGKVDNTGEIPFLPVELFKTHTIMPDGMHRELSFESSGTTGSSRSRHYIADASLYRESIMKGFEFFYGPVSQYSILALVPERNDSSLVYMLRTLIRESCNPSSGFYYPKPDELNVVINSNESTGQKTMLFGLAYALLDYAELFPAPLRSTIIAETGGMKGKRKEITRYELHEILCSRFGVPVIHSEYGMTELLSQAWSKGGGIFSTPPWMKVMVQELHDPLSIAPPGVTGIIRIIDLANIYSCAFITTGDLGKMHPDGTFEVLGRATGSEIRGCNLMEEI